MSYDFVWYLVVEPIMKLELGIDVHSRSRRIDGIGNSAKLCPGDHGEMTPSHEIREAITGSNVGNHLKATTYISGAEMATEEMISTN